jgi:hypothetical protein
VVVALPKDSLGPFFHLRADEEDAFFDHFKAFCMRLDPTFDAERVIDDWLRFDEGCTLAKIRPFLARRMARLHQGLSPSTHLPFMPFFPFYRLVAGLGAKACAKASRLKPNPSLSEGLPFMPFNPRALRLLLEVLRWYLCTVLEQLQKTTVY